MKSQIWLTHLCISYSQMIHILFVNLFIIFPACHVPRNYLTSPNSRKKSCGRYVRTICVKFVRSTVNYVILISRVAPFIVQPCGSFIRLIQLYLLIAYLCNIPNIAQVIRLFIIRKINLPLMTAIIYPHNRANSPSAVPRGETSADRKSQMYG